MATITDFNELKVWQVLNKQIFSEVFERDDIKDYALKDQLNRSAGSVMGNIAEGFGRGGNKEFINFLGFSLGSLSEVESQLIRGCDRSYLDEVRMEQFEKSIKELRGMLISFSNYLRKSDFRGSKFKVEEPESTYGNFQT